MPIQKGNKTVMTEEEARMMLEQMGHTPPSKKKKGKKSKQQQQSQPQIPMSSPNKGSGWWNDPLRHSLASMGIQTAITGKSQLDDLGTVYYPDDSYREGLRETHGKIQAETLKYILRELNQSPERYERLEEDVKAWIQKELGHLFQRYESQKNRQQLDNGMFKVPKEEYETLKEFENGIRDDIGTVKVWMEEMKSKYETNLREKENSLKSYASEIRSRYSDSPERYRRAINDKLADYQFELNQQKANIEYVEYIHETLDDTYERVKDLYNKATIEVN